MAVLINWKICDNSKDCNGPVVCPTKAFYWDDKKKTIAIEESKCVKCGKCEESCPVGAIRVAKTEAEYRKIKDEIDKDPRKVSDLFVDRYGGKPIHPAFLASQDKFDIQILEATKLAVAEIFNSSSIHCLVDSIPVKELLEGDIKYRKVELKDNSLSQKYAIAQLPALLFFKGGKLIGKIEGYCDIRQKDDLKKKIDKIISKK